MLTWRYLEDHLTTAGSVSRGPDGLPAKVHDQYPFIRIGVVERVTFYIREEIGTSALPDGIRLEVPPRRRVVVAEEVVVLPGRTSRFVAHF